MNDIDKNKVSYELDNLLGYSLILLFVERLHVDLGVPLSIVQSFSIISIVALPYIHFILLRGIHISSLLKRVLMFVGTIIFVSLLNLNVRIHLLTPEEVNAYLSSMVRQIPPLLIGLSIFIFLREIFYYNLYSKMIKIIVYSFIFWVITYSIFDLFFMGYRAYRFRGPFTEPSHMAESIALVVLPIALIYKYKTNLIKIITLTLIGISFILTFSLSGVIYLLLFFFFYFFFTIVKRNVKLFIELFLISIIFIFVFLLFLKKLPGSTYLIAQFSTLLFEPTLSPSFVDRNSFWLSLKNLNLISLLTGYGLGGESVYYKEIFEKDIASIIISVKAHGFMMGSFWGKITVAGGIWSFLAFLLVIVQAYKQIQILNFLNKNEKNIIKSAFLTILITATFTLGPFQKSTIWFWLAFIDGLYRKTLEGKQ